MGGLVSLLVALDAVSALAIVAVALYFVRAWWDTSAPQHLLFGLGLLVGGLSYATVAASHYGLGRAPVLWDHLRFVGQLSSPVVVLCAYLGRPGSSAARAWRAVGWGVVSTAIVYVVLYLGYPPAFAFPSVEQALPAVHGVATLMWGACAYLAYAGVRHAGDGQRALVPAGFLALALGKYTWLLADVTHDETLVLLVYPWRFLAVALFLTALRIPARRARRARDEEVSAVAAP